MRANGIWGDKEREQKNNQGESCKPFAAGMCSEERWWFTDRQKRRVRGRVIAPRNLFTTTAKNSGRKGRMTERGERDRGRRGELDWTLAAAQIISVSVTWSPHCPVQQQASLSGQFCACVCVCVRVCCGSSDRVCIPRSRCYNNEDSQQTQQSSFGLSSWNVNFKSVLQFEKVMEYFCSGATLQNLFSYLLYASHQMVNSGHFLHSK